MVTKPRRTDRLMVVGGIVTAIGLALTVVAMLPLVAPVSLSGAWWFLSMITGVGLALMCLGFWRAAHGRSAAVAAALSEPPQR